MITIDITTKEILPYIKYSLIFSSFFLILINSNNATIKDKILKISLKKYLIKPLKALS